MLDEACVPTRIKVIGVGGCGGNTINNLINSGLEGVEYFTMNTDIQALKKSEIKNDENKIVLGKSITNGLGAGAKPEIGQKAAEESEEEIVHAVDGADMIFVTAGMGGGSGTGAAPLVAKFAKESGALTVGVVTMPFNFEGTVRMKNAQEGLKKLKNEVDAIIVIPNEKLITVAPKASINDAFQLSDEILARGVQGISDIVVKTGTINLDFADIKTIMKDSGTARMGIGIKSGEGKAVEAALEAINSPLLEGTIKGAKGLIVNVCGGKDLSITDITKATEAVRQEADPDVNMIFGISINENTRENGEIQVTVIATGFDKYDDNNEKKTNTGYDISKVFSINQKNTAKTAPSKQTENSENSDSNEKKTPVNNLKKIKNELNDVDIPEFLKKDAN